MKIQIQELKQKIHNGLVRRWLSISGAKVITSDLLEAEMMGKRTHGISKVFMMDSAISTREGKPEVIKNKGNYALVDAHKELGLLSARFSLDLLLEKVKKFVFVFCTIIVFSLLFWKGYVHNVLAQTYDKGDANRDGVVDFADLGFVIDNFNQLGSFADVNGDGVVSIFDLVHVVSVYGTSGSPSTIAFTAYLYPYPGILSNGAGTADIVIDTATNSLSYTIDHYNLTGPVTAAHIHGFASAGNSAGVLHTINNADNPPVSGTWNYNEDQEANILNGLTYINLHTAQHPSGEIQGQLVYVAPPPPLPTPDPNATPTIAPPPPDQGGIHHPNFSTLVQPSRLIAGNDIAYGVPTPEENGFTTLAQWQQIPECPESFHNSTKWHPLYTPPSYVSDAAGAAYPELQLKTYGCHYPHEHKDNPHAVDDIFGTEYYDWAGGQEISYPWQTFHGAGESYPSLPTRPGFMENDLKHEAYGWLVKRDQLSPDTCDGSNNTNYCVQDFRVQFHAFMGAAGAVTRFHSYYLEARVRYLGASGTAQYAFIRRGGWIDFGVLHIDDVIYDGTCSVDNPKVDNQGNVITVCTMLPGDRLLGGNQRSHHSTYNDGAVWYAGNNNPYAGFALMSGDVWGPMSKDFPYNALNFKCPDFQCYNNGSRISLHRMFLRTDSNLDQSSQDMDTRPGWVAASGYTDRYGILNPNCTNSTLGLDCVPVQVDALPAGLYMQHDDQRGFTEYDSSPPSNEPFNKQVYWITYPN